MAFDYASRDYATIKSDLLRRASTVMPEWTDRDASDFGVLLVDLWSHMGDVLHYYVDRAAGEYFLSTATQRESVLAMANLFDYSPRSRSSAVGSVTLRNNSGVDHTVERNTKFIAISDNVTYNLYAPFATVVPTNDTATIILYEGTRVDSETVVDTSDGRSNQRYSLRYKNIVDNTISISVYEDGVNPVSYRRVDRIINASSFDRAFTSRVDADGFTQIEFGNSTYGFIPPTGSKVVASYVYSSGSSGNIPANSVTAFKDSTPTAVVIESSTKFSGGNDAESIDSLKAALPLIVSAQDRAVTANDFRSLALRVGGVSKAAISYNSATKTVTVYAHEDRSSDFTDPRPDAVDPTIDEISTGVYGQVVSSNLQTLVESELQPKAMLGVTVDAATTITWHLIDIDVTLHLNPTAVGVWVRTAVEQALDDLFAFSRVSFGQTITLGSVYRAVLGVGGVDWAEVTTFNNAGSSGVLNSISVNAVQLPRKGAFVVSIDPTDSGVSL